MAFLDEADKDKSGGSGGVRKVLMKAGDAGATVVRVGAGGANLELPSPAGAVFFNEDPNVVVQLVNQAGTCWTNQFSPADTKTNDAATFKAVTR